MAERELIMRVEYARRMVRDALYRTNEAYRKLLRGDDATSRHNLSVQDSIFEQARARLMRSERDLDEFMKHKNEFGFDKQQYLAEAIARENAFIRQQAHYGRIVNII